MIYYEITDKENKGIYISFTEKDKAEKWITHYKEVYEKYNIIGLHIIETERLTISERCDKAFRIANNSIYFDDNSDYLGALGDICRILNPNIDEYKIGKEYI
ncbi:MAG: hypothetical protein ACRC30_10995 [Clostridium sp.]